MRDDAPIPPTLAWLSRDVTGEFCSCNRRGHNALVPLAALIAPFGSDLRFPYVHGRLRCQACSCSDVHARPDWPKLGQVARHHATFYAPSRSTREDACQSGETETAAR